MDYINSIPKFELMFWACALPFTLIFIIQAILSFSGFDHSDTDSYDAHSFDAHSENSGESHSFPVFTFRNFVILIMVYGWTGLSLHKYGFSKQITVMSALMLGIAMMLVVAYIFYSMTKLQESGNTDIRNAINFTGNIYLTIPPKRSGAGKIQMTIQNALREYDAVTDDEKELETGKMARVTGIVNNNILLVSGNV